MSYNPPHKLALKMFSRLSLLQLLAVCLLFTGSATVRADFYVIPVGKSTSSISLADVKSLATAYIAVGDTEDLIEITPTASGVANFTVPAGKYLVITAMSVFPQNPGSGTVDVQFIQNSAARKIWKLPNSEPSHLSFGPGMLIAPNYALTIRNYPTSDGPIKVAIYGYLTDA